MFFMRKIINTIVSKLKGETFRLDDNVPLSYLFSFFFMKFVSLFYGIVKMGG